MMTALHREHALSDLFVAYLLARNIRYEEDLVDQLFNSSEKRLARVLLLLAHFGKMAFQKPSLPKSVRRPWPRWSAPFVRESAFSRTGSGNWDSFTTNGALEVHSSLLNVVLHD